jgi:hypothetical protein
VNVERDALDSVKLGRAWTIEPDVQALDLEDRSMLARFLGLASCKQ